MQGLIDSAVKLRYLYKKRTPASINTIREHLDNVYNIVQHENNQRDKCYSGIRAHVISNTVSLICEVYQSYLLNIEILNSEFFILVRDIIARAFNETRHESVSEDEKKLLEPVCDIVLMIADSMTPELANCNMISLFFGKTFVLSMTEGLKAFATNKVAYGTKQKAMIIKAILNMFSGYCVAKGDEAVTNVHVVSLVNGALRCVSSPVYFRIFDRQLQLTSPRKSLTPRGELFLDVCPKYVINYTKARREPMFAEAKHLIVKTAAHILHQFIPQIDQLPSYLLQCIFLLVELLLLIPPESFNSKPTLIKDLISIIKLSENDSLIRRSISLIYTLTTNADLCKIIIKSLSEDGMIDFFDKLSSTSSDKHIRFTSALISWTLNRENMTNRKYSSEMIKTFVRYLNTCEEDPLQQCHGVPLDTMITTLTDLVEDEDTQKELIKQDAVPVIMKCATDTQFDLSTVQQPSLECLLTMVFTPEVFTKLIESPKFLAHLRTLIAMTTNTTIITEDNTVESSEELSRVADSLLWKLEKEPTLLAKQNSPKKFEYDIMISYQHKDQDICEKIYDRLRTQNKFRVWFDRENLYGPIMTRMAEGIEKSEFVLVFMSELYQKSPYCRLEVIYASKNKRSIIPLKLYSDFKPTSWLGITVADLLYIDFSERKPFNVAYNELIEQIARYRQSDESELFEPELEEEEEEEEIVMIQDEQLDSSLVVKSQRVTIFTKIKQFVNGRIKSGKSNMTNQSRLNSIAASSISPNAREPNDISNQHASTTTDIFARKQIQNWTCNDIEAFLHEQRFEKFSQFLSDADGNDLFRLYLMSQDNNNKLLEYMREENPEIKLTDYLRFVRIVKKYIEQANTND